MTPNQVKEILLQQIKQYLDGNLSRFAFNRIAEEFYAKYISIIKKTPFEDAYSSIVPDACIIYIDEPGMDEDEKEKAFHECMCEAYKTLIDLV